MGKVILVANTSWYFFNFRLAFLRALQAEGWNIILAAPKDAYSERLRAQGFEWREFTLARSSLSPISALASCFQLWLLYRQERPVLVHHYTVKCSFFGSIAAFASGVPRVLNSVTGLGHLFLSPSVGMRALRAFYLPTYRFFSRGAGFLFQNAEDRDLFLSLGFKNKIYLVRGSGVDVQKIQPGTKNEGRKILFLARLLREKGIVELIEAARILHSRGLAFDLVLAGGLDPGNPSAISREEVQAWEQAGLVRWLGHVEEVESLLREVDILVLPSWREGLPKSLLEGAAAGLALVATDVPGCRELIQHEQDGILVPKGEATLLANALERLLKDPLLRQRLGAAARAKVEKEFAQELVHQKTIDIYRELLSQA